MPASIDAEQGLLGAILLNNDCYAAIASIVEGEDFNEEVHRVIFETARDMIVAGRLASPLTLTTVIPPTLDLGGQTAKQYLATLAKEATSLRHVRSYADIIRDLSTRRKVIGAAMKVMDIAYDSPVDMPADKQVEEFESTLTALRPRTNAIEGFSTFSAASADFIEAAAHAYQNDGPGAGGVPSGLPRFDEAIGGMYPGDLIVIGARPGAGKTALAVNIASHVARRERERAREGEEGAGRNAVFFSLEMAKGQLAGRVIADAAGIPFSRIRRGRINEGEFSHIKDVSEQWANAPFLIDETPRLAVQQMLIRCRRLAKRGKLALVIVDYLQLATDASSRAKREAKRHEEIGEVTSTLKQLAKECAVPVVALSQLSRSVDLRDDKRATLADFRESGSIEQDADTVAALYRHAYYLSKAKPTEGTEAFGEWERQMERWHDVAEVIVLKARNGPENRIRLRFRGDMMRFENDDPITDEAPLSPKAEDPEADRRARQKRMAPLSLQLLGVMRSAQIAHGVEPPSSGLEPALSHRNVRLVAWETAKTKFAPELPPGTTPAEVERSLRTCLKELRNNGDAYWTKDTTTGTGYIYLTPKA